MIPTDEMKFVVELLLVILFGIVMTGGVYVWLLKLGRIK